MSEIYFTGSDNSMFEPISVQLYSDGTPMVKTTGLDRIVRQSDTLTLRPSSLNQFVTAMFLVDAINHNGGRIERLVLPYVPGARQDRSNPTGDILFTARSVAKMINERHFSSVVILDPHSLVTTNCINNVVEYPLKLVANQFEINPWDAVIAPDNGGRVRAEDMAESLHQSVIYASKVRDVSTGRLSGFDVDVDAGCHYLISDDICDGGGTFIGLGERIREQGATADLYVSHGIFSKGTRQLKKIYNNIYTTDSLMGYHTDNDVTVIPVVKEMENYNA